MKKHFFLPLAAALFLASCQKENLSSSTQNSASPSATSANKIAAADANNADETILNTSAPATPGFIYTESNNGALNKIIIYKQHSDGTLTWWKEVASGGQGTGAGLGSQGAVCMSQDKKWLFAVNAGSNSFSVFSVNTNGDLTLKGGVTSLGEKPNSITSYGNMVYVLNNGNSTICGFAINNGVLTKSADSPHNLSGLNVDAPQIMFSPDGGSVIVTEKNTNLIDVFKLNEWGAITSAVYNHSHGVEPFGFSYARNKLIVSNAAGGAVNGGSCTAYKTYGDGFLHSINGVVPDNQTAPCWVATTKYGLFAYTDNASSNSVSTYYVDSTGALTFMNTMATGMKPLDVVVSENNLFVYNINSGSQTIGGFKRYPGGVLKAVGDVQVAPYAVGLAAY